jgi:hypothetical protein
MAFDVASTLSCIGHQQVSICTICATRHRPATAPGSRPAPRCKGFGDLVQGESNLPQQLAELGEEQEHRAEHGKDDQQQVIHLVHPSRLRGVVSGGHEDATRPPTNG